MTSVPYEEIMEKILKKAPQTSIFPTASKSCRAGGGWDGGDAIFGVAVAMGRVDPLVWGFAWMWGWARSHVPESYLWHEVGRDGGGVTSPSSS